jgi:hypothetical protein
LADRPTRHPGSRRLRRPTPCAPGVDLAPQARAGR